LRLRFTHAEDEHDPRYLVLAEGVPVTIGSSYGCTFVVADSAVAHVHLQVTLRGEMIEVETVRPTNTNDPTRRMWIDDVEAQPYRHVTLDIDHTIRIGETLIQLEHASVAPRVHAESLPDRLADAELGFLAKLATDPSDDATREIYADWLEGAGFPLRAGFIRLELEGGADIRTSEPLSRMVGVSTLEWRAAVSRTLIRHCHRRCARSWHQLAPASAIAHADKPIVRRCPTCQLDVPYCESRDIVPAAKRAVPVAYDPTIDRSSGDNVYASALAGHDEDTPPWG
jgi:uncharacterized protein (TIGR02996 family)